jgi:O-antigen/teichoic acid export membrane protein
LFRKDVFTNFSIKFKIELLRGSWLFFLLSLTGLLGSRIDQYCVSILLSKEDLGKYKVLKSFLIYTHAGIGFLLLPFVKNIYRLPNDKINKIANKLFFTAVLLLIPYIIVLYIIIHFIYGIEFSMLTYFYSALLVLPSSYYAVVIYKMFKNENNHCSLINVAVIFISLSLNVLLIPYLQIEGGLIASVLTQWLLLYLYYNYNKSSKRHNI